MKPIEEQIIHSLMESDKLDYNARQANEIALMKLAQEEPFGTSSQEFINHPALSVYIAGAYGSTKNYFMLWLRIEDYLGNKSDTVLAQEKLSRVEEALEKCLEKITPQAKARGVAMLPTEVANAQFMRNLYSIEDVNLTGLFLKYLPAPRANIFQGQAIPAVITSREQDAMQTIKAVLQNNDNNLPLVEHKVTKLQRKYRSQKRRQENIQRLPGRYAALWQSDIDNGDANVVCLGANIIDPHARHGIELQFDAKKIAENNPCVFFKQRDLGFELKKIRHVMIGDLHLHFSHTDIYRCQPEEVSSLVLCNSNGCQYAWSNVKKAILIADNINDMHQILTLNFFRFVDRLMNSDFSENIHDKELIYTALSELNDEELVEALLEIGRNMTDTMEFNFYGAYKIDFSALLTIKNDYSFYTLYLPSFIDKLKAGNLDALNEAMVKLPEIFNSYRFIDHLLSNTDNEIVMASLQEQREKCTLPAWMEEVGGYFKPK